MRFIIDIDRFLSWLIRLAAIHVLRTDEIERE